MPTFVLELGFISAVGEKRPGWFINDDLQTTAYFFIWPYADVDKENLTIKDIKYCECMTVPKSRLCKDFEHKGWTSNNLEKLDNALRVNDVNGSHSFRELFFLESWEDVCIPDNLKVCRSSKLAEDPVNLIVYKKDLAKFATGHYMVYPEVVKVLERPKDLANQEICVR